MIHDDKWASSAYLRDRNQNFDLDQHQNNLSLELVYVFSATHDPKFTWKTFVIRALFTSFQYQNGLTYRSMWIFVTIDIYDGHNDPVIVVGQVTNLRFVWDEQLI